MVKPFLYSEICRRLPPRPSVDFLPAIRAHVQKAAGILVVLDDDPTGMQTVHDVPVLTDWAIETLAAEMSKDTGLFYVLTNSRSLSEQAAVELAREAGAHLAEAARMTGRPVTVISRSDSTLRGHYPAEVDALAAQLGLSDAMQVVIPFFEEGGRITLGNVHYVREGDTLVPAGETPFARDSLFGYAASDLVEWIHEKTDGRIPAEAVAALSLETIRQGGPERIAEQLLQSRGKKACVVNAVDYHDLEAVTLGLLKAEEKGMRFVYRTAASFVRTRAGLGARPLVSAAQLCLDADAPGLILAGSHVPKTTAQLDHLMAHGDVSAIPIHVEKLLTEDSFGKEVQRASDAMNEAMGRQQDVLLFTSRKFAAGRDTGDSLRIGRVIRQGVIAVMDRLDIRPRYIIAKGGITASDVATDVLGIRRGWAVGQLLPGVPVWKTGPESRFPGLAYVVFPGNVGDVDALTAAVQKLRPGFSGDVQGKG